MEIIMQTIQLKDIGQSWGFTSHSTASSVKGSTVMHLYLPLCWTLELLVSLHTYLLLLKYTEILILLNISYIFAITALCRMINLTLHAM